MRLILQGAAKAVFSCSRVSFWQRPPSPFRAQPQSHATAGGGHNGKVRRINQTTACCAVWVFNSPNKVHRPRDGIQVPWPLPSAPILGAPLGPGPAHVVQLRPVEQSVREGAEQPRSAAMEESVDLWIHVSGPSPFPPWSRFDRSRFCLSASTICALKPGCLGAALRANSLDCGRVWTREAGVSAAMRRGDSAAGRSRRPFFGPDEGS
jgi:hypothetical protein